MGTPRYDNGYEAVTALLREHPEWKGVVKAALEEAHANRTGRFAGAWVLERARKHGISWIPNLRKLVAYGVLEKVGESSRGGRRAYYRMLDITGVEKALVESGTSTNKIPYPAHSVTDEGVAIRRVIKVPFFANLASCGSPNEAEAYVDEYIDVDIALAKPGHQYFVARADGDSMELAGINCGDAILVRAQDYAEVGQNVVACVGGGVTIKELQRAGNFSILLPHSSNKSHRPIPMAEDDVIQGVVVCTLTEVNN